MFGVRLLSLRKGAIATIFYSSMIFLGILGCILCALVVKCSPYISVLRPWSALNILPLFACFVLILLVSISPRCCVVFLLNRAPLLSSPVLAHMPRMVLLSVSIAIFLRPLVP